MADIIKVFTAEQLYTMYKNYLLSKGIGLTDFNEGSRTRALVESNSEIVSSISMDYKEALYNSIGIALYNGFGFPKTAAVKATGYMRLYRKPAFFITYTGAGTSALVTSDSTDFYAGVTGAPGDAFTFDYATYDTVGALVSAIDALSNWSATLVKDADIESTTLYQYSAVEAVSAVNYLYSDGLDILLEDDIAIVIIEGFSVTLDSKIFLTTAEGTLLAGESSVTIATQCQTEGVDGNISINAIDTLNGKSYINSSIDGIEQVINDSAFSGGTAEETDSQRKTRFAETVASLNAGTSAGIISAIKAITGVRSAGMRSAYPFNGTNTIIVDDGTSTISASLLAAVEKVLYGDPSDIINYPGKNAAGIGYNIVAPTIVNVDISVTVYRLPTVNVDLTEIETDVKTAIEQYINTRALGENVVLSEIVRVSKNSNAAAHDVIVTSPATNVLIDENEFSKTGAGTTGTVTVAVSITSVV